METAAQEIAALVAGQGPAGDRTGASGRGARARVLRMSPVLRMSVVNVLELVRSVWLMLGPFEDLVTESPEASDRAPRLQTDGPVRDGHTAIAQLSAGRAPAGDGLATSAA